MATVQQSRVDALGLIQQAEEVLAGSLAKDSRALEEILKESARDHTHGFFCHRWSMCRRRERKLATFEKRVGDYENALAELRKGNYLPAASTLDEHLTKLHHPEGEKQRLLSRMSPDQYPLPANAFTGRMHHLQCDLKRLASNEV